MPAAAARAAARPSAARPRPRRPQPRRSIAGGEGRDGRRGDGRGRDRGAQLGHPAGATARPRRSRSPREEGRGQRLARLARGEQRDARPRASELVEAAKSGDPRAFEALVKRYRHRIFALALHMTGSPATPTTSRRTRSSAPTRTSTGSRVERVLHLALPHRAEPGAQRPPRSHPTPHPGPRQSARHRRRRGRLGRQSAPRDGAARDLRLPRQSVRSPLADCSSRPSR